MRPATKVRRMRRARADATRSRAERSRERAWRALRAQKAGRNA